MTKKLYITGVPDIGNQGSFAMLKALVDSMGRGDEDYEYTLATNNTEAAVRTIANLGMTGIEVVAAGYQPAARSKLELILRYARQRTQIAYMRRRGMFRSGILAGLAGCHGIVNIGGDTLTHSSGHFTTIEQLDEMETGRRMGLKSAILAQTLGVYPRPYLYYIRHFMRKVGLITTRDAISYDYMHRIGVKDAVRTADLAFLLKPSVGVLDELALKEFGDFACVVPSAMLYRKTFSDIAELPKKHAAYLALMRSVVEKLLALGLGVLVLPHVFTERLRDDMEAQQIKEDLFGGEERVRLPGRRLYAHEAKEVLGRAQCVVSFRMHPTVAAVSQGIPSLLVTDSHKGQGVLGELEPRYCTIDARGLRRGDLERRLDKALCEFLSTIDAIRKQLASGCLEEVLTRAWLNIELLEELLEDSWVPL